MNNNVLARIGFDIVVAILIVHGWWFIALPLAIVAVWKFSLFIELLIAGVVYDALFGFVPGMGIAAYVGTLTAVIVFGGMSVLKKIVRK